VEVLLAVQRLQQGKEWPCSALQVHACYRGCRGGRHAPSFM
jgi:hypothetical protein